MSQNVDLQVLAGDYVKKAYIAEWHVKVGDYVKKDDALLSCETGKLTVDIAAPCDGIVEKILFPAGEEVDISETVAVIGDGTGAGAATVPASAAAEAPAAVSGGQKPAGRVFVSPVAMKIAKELDLDIASMKAAVGKARIYKEDVRAYAESLKNSPAQTASASSASPARSAAKEIPVKGRRRMIAQKMFESTSTKPRVIHMMDVDLEEIMKVKKHLSAQYPDRHFTVTSLLAVAVCRALRDCPAMNATYEDDTIYEHPDIRLGIAVDMEEGLIVPVVSGCEAKSGLALCAAISDTVRGCRENTLPPSAYANGTFTISNLGSAGVRYFTPIINAPEVAILGVGSMRREVALKNGQVTERRVLGLCLTFDHRAVDGAPAANFLRTVKDYMEHPFLLGF